MSPAEDYVLLGLRLGRHVDGLVDAYYGPAELSEQVEAEQLTSASELAEQGETLLARLEDGWLRDQTRGLRTYAGVLAGEKLSYSDEVEGCYGVRPERVAVGVYQAVHERLDELVPETGDLFERYEAWRRGQIVPPDRVVPALRDVVDELRVRTAAVVDLPVGEELVVEDVRDEPWWAFNYYLGDLRSRVVVNIDVPTTCDDLVHLAAHEVYPGHHTEHSAKEQRLVREQGRIEEAIQMVPTPAALVSEGIAEAGPGIVLEGEVPERLAAILEKHGLDYDFEQAHAVAEARRPLRRLGLDAALMIHEDGATTEQAAEHVRYWGLRTPEEAAQSVRFVTDPIWRAYAITYSSGRDLCHEWLNGDPARLARLLTEHVRVGDLLTALSSSS